MSRRPQKKRVEMTHEWIQEINRLYDSGMTYVEISQVTEYSPSCIAKYVWKPRRRGTRDK